MEGIWRWDTPSRLFHQHRSELKTSFNNLEIWLHQWSSYYKIWVCSANTNWPMVLGEETRNDRLNLKLERQTYLFSDRHMGLQFPLVPGRAKFLQHQFFMKDMTENDQKLEWRKVSPKILPFYFSSRSLSFILICQIIAYITGFLTLDTLTI